MTRLRPRALLAAALLALSAATAPAADAPAPESYWVFFGTSGAKGPNAGIFRAKFDAKAGTLGRPELAAEVVNPSFLAVHPTRQFLYAVGETSGKGGGAVHAFALDAKTGRLTKLNEMSSGGAGPCHVSVHPTGSHAIVANYGGGSSAVYKLGADGKLLERTAFNPHTRSGPPAPKGPKGHCGIFTPGGDFAVVADLGLDRLKVFKFDPATGKTDDAAAGDVVLPPGAGPRHVMLTPNGEYGYVCGELDSTVNVVKFDWAGNKPEVIQTLSTLPMPVKGNSTAECLLAPGGKFVYVSNRGHNSVAVFKVGADHKLTAAGYITGDIKTPRNFNVDPSGRWMLVASQAGDKVGVYAVDPATGTAKETAAAVAVPKPVCVKFVPVQK